MAFDPIDIHVGNRLRQRRALLGMSQTSLGRAVGLTFQQVQKYERGANRISSSRLYEFAQALDVPVAYFFEGIRGDAPATGRRGKARPEPEEDEINSKRETLELVRAYFKIRDADLRQHISKLVRSLSDN